jgi:hypothetical protein
VIQIKEEVISHTSSSEYPIFKLCGVALGKPSFMGDQAMVEPPRMNDFRDDIVVRAAKKLSKVEKKKKGEEVMRESFSSPSFSSWPHIRRECRSFRVDRRARCLCRERHSTPTGVGG